MVFGIGDNGVFRLRVPYFNPNPGECAHVGPTTPVLSFQTRLILPHEHFNGPRQKLANPDCPVAHGLCQKRCCRSLATCASQDEGVARRMLNF